MIPNLLENDEDSKKKKKERKREGRKKNRTDNEIVGNAAKQINRAWITYEYRAITGPTIGN